MSNRINDKTNDIFSLNEVKTLRVFTLGPAGTFSEQACGILGVPIKNISYGNTFLDVFQRTAADPSALAVVPIENSMAGTVAQVQSFLVEHQMRILHEIDLHIQYMLLCSVPLKEVAVCYAHPQAWEQCSEFMGLELSRAEVQFARSNTEAGARFSQAVQQQQLVAAIVPLSFVTEDPVWKSIPHIENDAENTTRFLVIKNRMKEVPFDFKKERTSLYIEPDSDHPGLLYELLQIFDRFGLNLCRLESRPSKKKQWSYVFFADVVNTDQTEPFLEALQNPAWMITVLGSYDVDRRS